MTRWALVLMTLSCGPDFRSPDVGDDSASGSPGGGGGGVSTICEMDSDGDGSLLTAPILSAEELLTSASPPSPIDEAAFAMPVNAPAPALPFSGRLELLDEDAGEMDTHFADTWISPGQTRSTLPEIDLEFVSCGRHIIPTQRGRISTEDPYWDLFVSPGLSWSTGQDGGMSRASFPFALTFKVENCIQNGVMTFLYDEDSVSQVRYQVTQETCPWHSFDLWGQSEARYTPGEPAGLETHQESFIQEVDSRYPIQPLEALESDFPGFSLEVFSEGLTLDEQTARGVLVGGTLYLGDCPTRFGSYPFCETVALPSYSLAKTLFLGLGMAAMAQELDVDPYEQEVSDLLPEASSDSPGQWDGVTLDHLIDMSTGHYRVASQADDYMGDFFTDFSLDDRLRSSFLFPYQEPPGRRTVYLTPHSQIAAAALDAILEQQGHEITDGFDYVVERIYRPAGMPADSFSTLRTWEGGGQNNGTAFGGYGLLLTPQGLASLGRFVLGGGLVDGEPVFHPDRLEETLFRDLSDTGAPMNYYDWSYNNGMWGYPLERWGCEGFVPTLFGVSGVTVMLAPNDVVYFAFNDQVEQPFVTVLDELDAIASLCP